MSAKGGLGATSSINLGTPSSSVPSHSGGASGGGGPAYGSAPSPSCGDCSSTSPVNINRLAYQHGHSFVIKTFRTPTNCHYCGELLWGLMGKGYICEGKFLIWIPLICFDDASSDITHIYCCILKYILHICPEGMIYNNEILILWNIKTLKLIHTRKGDVVSL